MTHLWNSLRGLSRLLDKRSRSRSSRPCVEFCEGRTLLSAVLWTGGAGTDDWDTAANWNSDSLPGSGDSVTIPAGATVVHSDSDSDSIGSLTSSGTLSIAGGTLAIASASTAGTLTINGGTLTADGSLSVGGTLSLLKGTLAGSGTVDAMGGMNLDTPASTQFVLDGVTLDNAAGETATWTTAATGLVFTYGVLMQDGAILNNFGTMTVSGADIFAGTGALPTFNNDGSLIASGTSSSVFQIAVTFDNSGGTVDVQEGTLQLIGPNEPGPGPAPNQAVTSTGGTFTAESGATLELGGISSFDAATTINGAGTVSVFDYFPTYPGDVRGLSMHPSR